MNWTPYPITLRQLQYLVAVAEHGGFRRASQECHVAQPSLSAQIAQAEAALGVRIFERDRRSVVLTRAGQTFVDRARDLLLAGEELIELARSLSDPFGGTLRIGVIPTIAPYLLPEVAPILRTRFGRLNFVWTEDKTEALMGLLSRGDVDAAILALEANIGDLPHMVLSRDPFVFAAAPSHPLAVRRRPIRAADLEGQQILLLDDGHCFRSQVLAYCARAGADEVGYRATSLQTLVQMVAAGGAVTLLPTLALPVENRRHALRVRPFASKAPFRTIVLAWRPGSALATTLRTIGDTLRSAYPQSKP